MSIHVVSAVPVVSASGVGLLRDGIDICRWKSIDGNLCGGN